MRVRISISLDFNGTHTFQWEPSDAPGAVDVPRALLERWASEREAYELARRRWQHVTEDIEEYLLRAEERRTRARSTGRSAPRDRSAPSTERSPSAIHETETVKSFSTSRRVS